MFKIFSSTLFPLLFLFFSFLSLTHSFLHFWLPFILFDSSFLYIFIQMAFRLIHSLLSRFFPLLYYFILFLFSTHKISHRSKKREMKKTIEIKQSSVYVLYVKNFRSLSFAMCVCVNACVHTITSNGVNEKWFCCTLFSQVLSFLILIVSSEMEERKREKGSK